MPPELLQLLTVEGRPISIGLTFRDVETLEHVDLLSGLIQRSGNNLSMNEHAHRAFTEFYSEVDDAFRKLQDRLELLRNAKWRHFPAEPKYFAGSASSSKAWRYRLQRMPWMQRVVDRQILLGWD